MKFIKPLASLRFFAILAIFLFHLYPQIFSKGYIGVNFFFMLSGFLLSLRYLERFKKPGLFSLRKFFATRIVRIYPLHLFTLFISLPISGDNSALGIIAARFLSNLLLVQSFIPKWDYFFSYNWVSWFLSDFLFCIVMFPLLMFVLSKLRMMSKNKSLALILIIWLLAMIMARLGFWGGNVYWFYYISPFMRLADFAIGMLLGIFFLSQGTKSEKPKVSKDTFWEITSIGFLALLAYLSPATPNAYTWSLFFAPGVALIIYTFAQSKGLLSQIISADIWVKLGSLSFAFFLIHQLVIRYLLLAFAGLSLLIFATMAFTISLGSSYLYQKYLEVWTKERLMKIIQKHYLSLNNI